MSEVSSAAGGAPDAGVDVDQTPDPVDEERLAEQAEVGRQAAVQAARDAVVAADRSVEKAAAQAAAAQDAAQVARAELAALEGGEA